MRRSRQTAVSLCVMTLSLSGCALLQPTPAPQPLSVVDESSSEESKSQASLDLPSIYDGSSDPVEVMRTGRYQLVSARASNGQQHLLEQMVDVDIPTGSQPTVGDALRYVLRGTGYELCDSRGAEQNYLYSRPLPAPHYQFGPMPLREALQMLAGESWTLDADRITRTVCYEPQEPIRFGVTVASDRRLQQQLEPVSSKQIAVPPTGSPSTPSDGGAVITPLAQTSSSSSLGKPAPSARTDGGADALELFASTDPELRNRIDVELEKRGNSSPEVNPQVERTGGAGSDGASQGAMNQPQDETASGEAKRGHESSAKSSAADSTNGTDTDHDQEVDPVTIEIDPPKVVAAKNQPLWRIDSGVMLNDGIEKWMTQADGDWHLVWLSRVNYRITSAVEFSGTLEEAVTDLVTLYSSSDKPLYADISPSQQLVVISDNPKELGQ